MPVYLFKIQRLGEPETETIEVGADEEWQAIMVIAEAHPGVHVIEKILEYPSHIRPGHA